MAIKTKKSEAQELARMMAEMSSDFAEDMLRAKAIALEVFGESGGRAAILGVFRRTVGEKDKMCVLIADDLRRAKVMAGAVEVALSGASDPQPDLVFEVYDEVEAEEESEDEDDEDDEEDEDDE